MMNMNDEESDVELDITDDVDTEMDEPELVDMEEKGEDKLKKMREKLAHCEEEKKKILDDSQLTKADFLNARKRLEEERVQNIIRQKKIHVEELLPLCDSFQMAMADKDAWEKIDETWRSGVEKIHTQLLRILDTYEVTSFDPLGEKFDHHRFEAIGTEEVEDKKLEDTVVTVVQHGYEIKMGDKTELVRPARVTTGVIKE